jgi:hypothetical protein
MLFTKSARLRAGEEPPHLIHCGSRAACIHLLRTWLPERENVGLDPAREEGDLEGAVADQSALADQVVSRWLDNPSVPLVVDVDSADTSLRDEPAGRALRRDLRPFCVVERGVCGRCRRGRKRLEMVTLDPGFAPFCAVSTYLERTFVSSA